MMAVFRDQHTCFCCENTFKWQAETREPGYKSRVTMVEYPADVMMANVAFIDKNDLLVTVPCDKCGNVNQFKTTLF